MPRFITIGYGDRAGYDRTPRFVRDAAHAQDARLRSEGAVMGIAGTPVQVRNPEARGLETLDGPFMSSALPIAGFAIIEAADLADVIAKVSQTPCAVAWRRRSLALERGALIKDFDSHIKCRDPGDIIRLTAHSQIRYQRKPSDVIGAAFS